MSDGKLKEAIEGDWAKAMKPPTLLNRGIGIDELLSIAQENHQEIRIIATPSGINVNVANLDVEASDEE